MIQNVCTYITSKQIEVPVGQVWSGFEFVTKPNQPRLSSLIRLEVIKDKRKILIRLYMRFLYRVLNRNQELCSYAHGF